MTEAKTGRVEAVLVGHQPDSLVSTRTDSFQVVYGGIHGDRHFGQTHLSGGKTKFYPRGTVIYNDRQVSLVSAEELKEIAETLKIPEILPEWLGANLLLSGIPDMTRLAPGTRLFFSSGAVLYVTRFNNPCSAAGDVIQAQYPERNGLSPAFVRHAMHRRGLVAMVDIPGLISAGDIVGVEAETHYLYQE